MKKPEKSTNKADSEDDLSFREAMADVRPLDQDRIDPYRAPVSSKPRQKLADDEAVMRDLAFDPLSWADLEAGVGEELFYADPSLGDKQLRKLKKGLFAIQAELDLHGQTREQALESLQYFIAESLSRHYSCVRVIHGRGLGSSGGVPVLKALTNSWLRKQNVVLAFCSARPQHGGTGAVYILLKRR